MAISNLIITKSLMMEPSVDALGFLILTMRKNRWVFKARKLHGLTALGAAPFIFFYG
jgi:hypothetical protein